MLDLFSFSIDRYNLPSSNERNDNFPQQSLYLSMTMSSSSVVAFIQTFLEVTKPKEDFSNVATELKCYLTSNKMLIVETCVLFHLMVEVSRSEIQSIHEIFMFTVGGQ